MNYYNNQYNYGFGGGVQYQQPQKINATNALSKEEFEEMLRNGKGFQNSIAITEEDTNKAKCTHRHPGTGVLTLNRQEDGSYVCDACGRHVKMLDNIDMNYITDITTKMVDIMETIKIMWQNIPVDMINTYFLIEPVLEKIPLIAKMANGQFNSIYNNDQNSPYTNVPPQNNAFSMLNNLTNGINPMGNMFQQPPMYGQYNMGMYQQAPYQQQFNPNIQYGQSNQMGYNQPNPTGVVANGNNPFGYNGPAPAPQQPVQTAPNNVTLPPTNGEGNKPPQPRVDNNVKVTVKK